MTEVAHYNAIDAQVVAEFRPCECGGRYFYKGIKDGDSYRAFAVCPDCHDEIEF